MSNPCRGLKKHGLRGYLVSGPGGTYIIERSRPYCWWVKNAAFGDRYGNFFAQEFARLGPAREYAERMAGVNEADNFPDTSMPKFLRRWTPRVRA